MDANPIDARHWTRPGTAIFSSVNGSACGGGRTRTWRFSTRPRCAAGHAWPPTRSAAPGRRSTRSTCSRSPTATPAPTCYLTMLSAAEAVEALPDDVDAAVVWQTLSHGALVGARGNSGVIVSQALRGLAEVLQGRRRPERRPGQSRGPGQAGGRQAGRGHRAERPGGRAASRPKWSTAGWPTWRGGRPRRRARRCGAPPGSSTCWPAAASWTRAAPGWRSCWSRWPR